MHEQNYDRAALIVAHQASPAAVVVIILYESALSICTLICPDEVQLTLRVLDGHRLAALVEDIFGSRAFISATLEPEKILLIVYQGTSLQDHDLVDRHRARCYVKIH